MTIRDLSELEICGLQAIFPDIIKSAAPLPADTLKKLLTIINDEQKSRRERVNFRDWVKSFAELIMEEHPTDEIKVGDRVEVIYQSGNRKGVVCEIMYDGTVDVDFGGGCLGHGILQDRIIKLDRPKPQPNDNTITIPVKADLDDTYWDAYRTELVKEIAVKLADKETIMCPSIADYATDFASRIVDNLKKREQC